MPETAFGVNPSPNHWVYTHSIFQSKNEPEIGPGGKGQAAG